jgi:TPP-dependent trihydroxycyclohexane-1,2-dione (THcHDO) dehydratase
MATSGKARPLPLTAAQAVVKYLQVQYSERDGRRQRLIPALFGIFGPAEVEPHRGLPDAGVWCDIAIADTSGDAATRRLRSADRRNQAHQRLYY